MKNFLADFRGLRPADFNSAKMTQVQTIPEIGLGLSTNQNRDSE